MTNQELQHINGVPIPLWSEGAPGAQGTADSDNPSITPYLVEASEPTAAIVVCPGGGYGGLAPHEGEPVARWLNSLGISAVVLRYRVAPYKHPHPLLDAQRALRYVRAHASEWKIDPRRSGILGFSAGGHLAATAGTHYDAGNPESPDPVEWVSCRPDLLVLCYAVISFGTHRHNGSMVNLIGENPPDDLRSHLSNELQITANTPPTFLWHTADDAAVPVENSLLFAQALSRYQIPFELHVFAQGRHGLGLAPDDPSVSQWTRLCAIWLEKQGFGRT